jgi:hypothetical protein
MYDRRGSTKRTIITWTNTIVETLNYDKSRLVTYPIFTILSQNNFKMVKNEEIKGNNSFSLQKNMKSFEDIYNFLITRKFKQL